MVISTQQGTEEAWRCIQPDPDVTMSLISTMEIDEGSTIFNNRFLSQDMSLRVRQITTLAELIKKVQKPQDAPGGVHDKRRWVAACGDFNMVSGEWERSYPLGTLEQVDSDMPGYVPADVCHSEFGVSFVRH